MNHYFTAGIILNRRLLSYITKMKTYNASTAKMNVWVESKTRTELMSGRNGQNTETIERKP